MKKVNILFLFSLISVNVFAVEQLPGNNIMVPSAFVPKCEDANFQYPKCIDKMGKIVPNPKFKDPEPGKRRGITKSPHVKLN